jgi:acyl carrier protein
VASVAERVIDIVAEQLGANKETITRDTSFVNDLKRRSPPTKPLLLDELP